MEFKEYRLGDLAKYSQDKIETKKVTEDEYITTENMLPNRQGVSLGVKLPKTKSVSHVKKDNILISNIRPYFKKIFFSNSEYGCSNDVLNIEVIDKDTTFARFLYYCLFSEEFFDYVMLATKGTKMPRGDKTHIMNYVIKLPSLDNQKKIAKILSNIDKKIELNNKMNDNLYNLLLFLLKQTVKKSTMGKVRDLGYIQSGFAFKSKDLLNTITNNKVIKIKNISSIEVDINNTQFVNNNIANSVDKKFLLNEGNVIIAMTGAEIGKTGYLCGKDKFLLNQRVGVVRGNDKTNELYLNVIFLTKEIQKLVRVNGHGSAQPNISGSEIEKLDIAIPEKKLLNNFYIYGNNLYKKLISNKNENSQLEKVRNTILPKLMNGEIELNNIII